MSSKNSFVKVPIVDWIDNVFDEIKKQYPACAAWFSKDLAKLYRDWAIENYAEKEVPTPTYMAVVFFNDGEYYIRSEEDRFLIKEMQSRTEPMNDSEWFSYCQTKGALVWNDKCAIVSDGIANTEITF